MKRTAFVLAVVVVSGCFGKPSMERGKEIAQPLIDGARDYKQQHGVYPAELTLMKLSETERKRIARHNVRYHALDDGQGYVVGFDVAGIVHLCAFGEGIPGGSEPSEWSCAVK